MIVEKFFFEQKLDLLNVLVLPQDLDFYHKTSQLLYSIIFVTLIRAYNE